MTGFLTQIGKNLADRWLAVLVLPGLLWTAVAVGAYHLGQARPLETKPLASWLGHLISTPTAQSNGTIALTTIVALLASTAAGLAAGGLGAAVQHVWGAPGDNPPLSWIRRARYRRWQIVRETARRKIGTANDPALSGKALARARAAAARAYRRLLALPQPPQRPTYPADRFHMTAERARTMYGLDLNLVWPRLWAVLPETLRADVSAATDRYITAARLGGWSLLYAALAVLWWPAAIIAIAIAAVSTGKAHASANALADLIDTAIDLHLADLAGKLHITLSAPDAGKALTRRLAHPNSGT